MGKFWKEIVGGQVQQGVYLAGPRHASKQYGSFKTGRPPRLPFQFVTYFELNNMGNEGLHQPGDDYHYSSLVRAIDMPSVDITVEKRNQYNKLKPVILTKNFKPFTMSVYDDIESRWYGLWQHFYNYHFMEGRRPYGSKHSATHNADVVADKEILANLDASATDIPEKTFDSDRAGPDIHSDDMKNYFKAIHVFQIHGEYVTRTTALNPVLVSAEMTQLDYASSGAPSEISFTIEYEKLEYGPTLNYKYKEGSQADGEISQGHLESLLEDYTKAPVFDPSQDKVKGLVQAFLGLEQSNITVTDNLLQRAGRDVMQKEAQQAALIRDGGNSASRGFFSSLIANAIDKKLDEATGDLFKKQNKNLNKLNFF